MSHSYRNELASGLGRHAADLVPPTEPLLPQNVLALTPEIRRDHSTLLDFAYEEYCRAVDRGDSIDQEQFAAGFPEIEKLLLELLEVHSFVVGNSLLTAVEPDIHWPTPGEVFLGFELLEEIGQGAFSRVFLAREVELGNRRVVVKVSQKGTSEASMLGVLDHPNIIPVHSITADHAIKLSALCMPYLGRTTAAEWIQTRFKAASAWRVKSQRHYQSVIDIGMGVCQGLKFAHARQVLHCDIKPSNILITHDGEPVLLDFNLSTNPNQEIHLLGGTLMYMAPEQILRAGGDRTASITERTDVYCLGATLYQMATGQLPFPLDTPSPPRLKDVMDVALEARRAFSVRSHSLPGPLHSLLRDAIAFDPNDRISSASDFYERLLACQNQLRRPHSRSKWAIAVTGALAAGLVAFSLTNRNAAAPEPLEKPGQFNKDTSPVADSAPVDPMELARQAERDGRYQDAIGMYQQILDEEVEVANLAEAQASLIHSLAFCLMMHGQYVDANIAFSRLQTTGFTHKAFPLNRAACMVLLALSPEGQGHHEHLRATMQSLKNLAYSNGNSAEHQHALAIIAALLSKSSQGNQREQAIAFTESLFWIQCALISRLPVAKALVIGHLIPAANERSPLRRIVQENPALVPDRTLNLPVQSPVSYKATMAKGIVP